MLDGQPAAMPLLCWTAVAAVAARCICAHVHMSKCAHAHALHLCVRLRVWVRVCQSRRMVEAELRSWLLRPRALQVDAGMVTDTSSYGADGQEHGLPAEYEVRRQCLDQPCAACCASARSHHLAAKTAHANKHAYIDAECKSEDSTAETACEPLHGTRRPRRALHMCRRAPQEGDCEEDEGEEEDEEDEDMLGPAVYCINCTGRMRGHECPDCGHTALQDGSIFWAGGLMLEPQQGALSAPEAAAKRAAAAAVAAHEFQVRSRRLPVMGDLCRQASQEAIPVCVLQAGRRRHA